MWVLFCSLTWGNRLFVFRTPFPVHETICWDEWGICVSFFFLSLPHPHLEINHKILLPGRGGVFQIQWDPSSEEDLPLPSVWAFWWLYYIGLESGWKGPGAICNLFQLWVVYNFFSLREGRERAQLGTQVQGCRERTSALLINAGETLLNCKWPDVGSSLSTASY